MNINSLSASATDVLVLIEAYQNGQQQILIVRKSKLTFPKFVN